MKTIKICGLVLLFTCCFLNSKGQDIPINEPDYNKPALFNEMPVRLDIDISAFKSILALNAGESAVISFHGGHTLHGQVISVVSKYEGRLQSIIIKFSNKEGATLTLTSIKNDDGTITYRGRILSMRHSDGFDIKQKDGRYYFEKIQLTDIVNE